MLVRAGTAGGFLLIVSAALRSTVTTSLIWRSSSLGRRRLIYSRTTRTSHRALLQQQARQLSMDHWQPQPHPKGHDDIECTAVAMSRDETTTESFVAGKKNNCGQLYVGNLDWNVSVSQCEQMLRDMLHDDDDQQQQQPENVKKDDCKIRIKPATNRPRDVDKHHAGSATLTFATPAQADLGLERLRQQQQNAQSISADRSLRVRYAFSARHDNTLFQESESQLPPFSFSAERIQLRKDRAASYARRRKRVASATDVAIEKVLTNDDNGVWQKRLFQTSVPILRANELDWDTAPSEIDPTRGGGLTMKKDQSRNSAMHGRATRKRAAVEAFLQVVQDVFLNPHDDDGEQECVKTVIADLGCGAGNLALPLAYWLQEQANVQNKAPQKYSILGVDLNAFALQRLRDRADSVADVKNGTRSLMVVETLELDLLDLLEQGLHDGNENGTAAAVDPRLLFANCSAVVSLHACGAASDLSMAAAVQYGLPFAISPCCIGKGLQSRSPPPTRQNNFGSSSMPLPPVPPSPPVVAMVVSSSDRSAAPEGVIAYPRSNWLRVDQNISPEEYALLAAAADYGETRTVEGDERALARWQRSRQAKQIVEMDRLQWAQEQGYYVRMLELPRIGTLYSKRELLLGAVRDSLAARRLESLPVEM